MKKTVEIGQMSFSCPEGFHEMDNTELEGMKFSGTPNICLSFPERHIIISAGEREINFFSAAVLNLKDIMKTTENDLHRLMKEYGYRLGEMSLKQTGEVEAGEIPYTYTAQDVKMYGCTYVFKRKRTLCYLHWYTREALKEENREVLEEILESLRWK
ncbi:MAG: hypothetical protein II529_06550 [Erysipelotrichaceae bacterium]|nr:hypothetical protein [Erysipelotrichaceae bacterium]MBQ2583270.1 hypothetical protein [Erysipelotrichaceae bacterium]